MSRENKRFDTPRFKVSGDRALLLEYGEGINAAVNERVRVMSELLQRRPPPGMQGVVPSYRSLSLVYDPLKISPEALKVHVLSLDEGSLGGSIPEPKTVEIPVCYGGDFGPDIEFVAETNGLGVDEVIALHSSNSYHIYTIGFAPGFCYLGGLDARLRTPRLETPRALVPAGSVGIAESQTGVYPLANPGGWRLIGRTPLRLFAPERPAPFLYKAGDKIKFKPITPEHYEVLAGRENP